MALCKFVPPPVVRREAWPLFWYKKKFFKHLQRPISGLQVGRRSALGHGTLSKILQNDLTKKESLGDPAKKT